MQPTEEIKAVARAAAIQAINILGGPVAAARKVEAPSYQAAQGWRVNGVPVRFCLRVNSLTGVSLQGLRPADWSHYWPASLAGKEPA